MLSQVKLIAEPWDVGPGGYQVGNFPVLWSEWNGIYRDTMRDFWRGEAHVGEFAQRLTGSSDLYQDDGRHPFASINFITAHDGFTLRDLVSYNEKHNEANKEGNRDGTDDNRSWNYGVEGETDDPEINALRDRQQRNFLATLLLSQGTPMMLGGDEFGRTQGGNNNGWCQDSEISWFDWSLLETNAELLDVHASKLIALRRAHAVFRRRQFLFGREVEGSGPARRGLVPPRRRAHARRGLGRRRRRSSALFLNGEEIASPDVARAPGARRVVPAAVQRPPRGPRVHAAGRRRSARRGRSCWTRRGPSVEPGDETLEAGDGARAGPPLAGPAAPRPAMTELRATYRLQLGGDFGFAAARELVPYLADLGVSHVYLPPSFQAREGSTHGYDVVDPTSISNELGGEEEFFALVRRGAATPGWASCSTSSRTTWRRTTQEPLLERPAAARAVLRHRRARPAATGASSTSTTSRRSARRTRRCSRRRTSSRCGWCARGIVDGLRIDHPDGLADPAGYLARLREGGVEHVWVEKILDPGEPLRDWPIDGTVGYEFLNDVCGLFVDPAGEAPLTDLWVEVSRRRPALRRARVRGQARAGADGVRAGGRAAAARGAGAGGRAGARAGVAARLPHLRRAVVGARRG